MVDKPFPVKTTEMVSISTKRLAELEFIEKNIESIVKSAVEQTCADCISKCCTASHDYSNIISKIKRKRQK